MRKLSQQIIFNKLFKNSQILKSFRRKDQTLNLLNQNKNFFLNNQIKISSSFCTAQEQSTEQTFHKQKVENREFQTETKKILDIVAKSLYTDKEVFIRELLSNASDALEKQRYQSLKNTEEQQGDPLQISITVDPDKKRIIIQDTGIGMTRDDLISHLGTIARSGSKQFVETVKGDSNNGNVQDSIIGQFGVGFYSSFIVGNSVEVISKSQGQANMWISDGSGTYEISEIDNPGFERGTKIIINLRPTCLMFSKYDEVKKIIQKYSNFINHPIYLNGERINQVQAIWAMDKKQVTEEQYQNFYEFVANTKIHYRYKLHYQTDAPLSIKTLLFVPSQNNERIGSQQLTVENSDVALYSRKVLIKQHCAELFPSWLRFIKGVVDCEDIPLNISRENYQDSSLIARLRSILTKRVIKMFNEESTKNPELYLSWYKDFQYQIKEGLFTDTENQDLIMQLVRYQCNWQEGFISLDEYVSKLEKGQDKIYYVLAANRESALSSPYMEPFRNTNVPVIFLYHHVDELMFAQVNQYKNKYKFVNVETNYDDVSKDLKKDDKKEQEEPAHGLLPQEDVTPYCLWLKNELQPVIHKVEVSKRLKDSPALVVGKISSGMRTMMSMIDSNNVGIMDQNLTLEVNPNHELIIKLNELRKTDMKLANLLAKQLLDNCLIIAGAVTDPRQYVNRINTLMLKILQTNQGGSSDNTINVEAHRELQDDQSILNDIKIDDLKSQQKQQNTQQEFTIDENGNPKFVNKK